MENNEKSNGLINKRGHRLHSSRSGGLLGGILLVAIGFYWFGQRAGWFPHEIHMFWPVIVIIIGVWVIAIALLRRI